MNWKLLNQPLGSDCLSGGYAPRKKEVAPLVIPLAMAAASALSSIFGGAASSAANRKARAELDAEKSMTDAERRKRKYETWANTMSGQNTIRMLNDQAKSAYDRIRGAAAVGGATDAAVAQEKELQNLKQAEVIANANAAFEDKKDQVDAGYRQELRGLTGQQIALDQQQGQNIAQAAQGVSSALMQGASAVAGANMGAGSPGGAGVSPSPSTSASQLQGMGGGTKVSLPAFGNTAFAHQFGKTNNLNDWIKNLTLRLYNNK